MANAMMAFAICFFPIVLTTARGLREVEPELLDLVHTLKGSRWHSSPRFSFRARCLTSFPA
jgi:NitT/TauT family transport system permease protein